MKNSVTSYLVIMLLFFVSLFVVGTTLSHSKDRKAKLQSEKINLSGEVLFREVNEIDKYFIALEGKIPEYLRNRVTDGRKPATLRYRLKNQPFGLNLVVNQNQIQEDAEETLFQVFYMEEQLKYGKFPEGTNFMDGRLQAKISQIMGFRLTVEQEKSVRDRCNLVLEKYKKELDSIGAVLSLEHKNYKP